MLANNAQESKTEGRFILFLEAWHRNEASSFKPANWTVNHGKPQEKYEKKRLV